MYFYVFSKMCENKGPVIRQGLLRTRSFAFFVAGFDAEQLENSSYSSFSKNLFDFKKLKDLLSSWKSVSVLLLHIIISLRNLRRRRQYTTKTVHQSTKSHLSSLKRKPKKSICDSRYSTNIQAISFS